MGLHVNAIFSNVKTLSKLYKFLVLVSFVFIFLTYVYFRKWFFVQDLYSDISVSFPLFSDLYGDTFKEFVKSMLFDSIKFATLALCLSFLFMSTFTRLIVLESDKSKKTIKLIHKLCLTTPVTTFLPVLVLLLSVYYKSIVVLGNNSSILPAFLACVAIVIIVVVMFFFDKVVEFIFPQSKENADFSDVFYFKTWKLISINDGKREFTLGCKILVVLSLLLLIFLSFLWGEDFISKYNILVSAYEKFA
ncbi:hypothetical protein HYO33_23230 [Vibrio parahaemolyticus]|nr:hypothetical protein [Vibrio parahaemolyticus]